MHHEAARPARAAQWGTWLVPLALLALGAASHGLGWDTAAGRVLRDPGTGEFALAHSWYFDGALRVGSSIALAFACLMLGVAALGGPREARSALVFLFACETLSILAALVLSGLAELALPGSGAGPDPLVAAGFGWIGLACLAQDRVTPRMGWWLLPGIALGLLVGLAQVVRGARPPSSVALALATDWVVVGALYATFRGVGWLTPQRDAQRPGSGADRALPWIAALGAGLVGVVVFSLDLLLDAFGDRFVQADHVFEALELGVMGLGLGTAGFFVAVHMRATHQHARSRLAQEREERLRALGRVAASVAHEVRNPLHTLRLIVDEQRREVPALEVHPLRGDLDGCLERIDHAVDLVYRLARPEFDEGETADLRAVAEASVQRVARGADRSQRFRWVGEPPERAPVRGSTRSLEIVVDNLLRNADTAAPAAAQVELALSTEGQDRVLQVVNPGRLGEQADESGSKAGLGLGLSIARQLAANAGAAIDLQQSGERVVCRLVWPAEEGGAA